jgi:glycosyltransferase involved in cell wall biosynthesis
MTEPTITQPLITVVIPCLNEEKTIGLVIQEAQDGFRRSGHPFEVLVADNGSNDESRTIAEGAGARVVDVPTKGYGVALRTGIRKARGSIVIFGDADLTYDFREGPALVNRLLKNDAELIIGTRLKGSIEDGAMPWWHRYIGTPALTYLIGFLFGAKITDSNSGFRAFHVRKFNDWEIHSDGMEICSEVIINCLKSGDRIAEVPITLRRDRRDRAPHLSTWRDGMRNLLIILSRAAHGFTYLGLSLLLVSAIVAVPSALVGHITLGPFSLFEHHSLILAILVGFLGSQSIFYGLLLDTSSKHPLAINRYLLQIHEVRMLKLLGLLLLITASFVVFLFTRWIQHSFNNINYLLPSLTVLYCAVVLGSLGFGIFIVQVQKKGPAAMKRERFQA